MALNIHEEQKKIKVTTLVLGWGIRSLLVFLGAGCWCYIIEEYIEKNSGT